MFKKMKLRGKIFGGFAIVLILLVGVALVGFYGLSNVMDRSGKVYQVNELVRDLLETRQIEKDYMLSGDPDAAQKVSKDIGSLKRKAAIIGQQFSSKKNEELFEKVGKQIDVYQNAFSHYVGLKSDKEKILKDMQSRVDIAMKAIQNFREAQSRELLDIRGKGQIALSDQMKDTEKINDLLNRILENRATATELIYNFDQTDFESWNFSNTDTLRYAEELKEGLQNTKAIEQLDKMMESYQKHVDEFKNILSKKEKELKKDSKELLNFLQKSQKAVNAGLEVRVSFSNELDKTLSETNKQMDERLTNTNEVNELYSQFVSIQKEERNFVDSGNGESYTKVISGLDQLFTQAEALGTRLRQLGGNQQIGSIITDVTAFKNAFLQFKEVIKDQAEAVDQMLKAAQATQNLCYEAEKLQKSQMTSQSGQANGMMLGGTFIAFIVGMMLAFFMARVITKSIQYIISGLNETSEKVSSVSGQQASTSQSLAEGSSQQAASVEETSSSLEEIASMANQNASHAKHADKLMKEAKEVVSHANTTMKKLMEMMREVSTASAETSKIIKTIDEIAFQTNLLALNAAVEAARAGEAGAGFAVVADEVRNLAIRASEAAKSTASLIDNTSSKVNVSAKLVTDTDDAFSKVTESASKVAELISEISSASDEQAQGIELINKAVAEMDKIIQQNAASAEESAGSAQELNAQAKQLEAFIVDLTSLVGKREESQLFKGKMKMQLRPMASKPAIEHKKRPWKNAAFTNAQRVGKTPQGLIPLQDEGLEEF